MIQENYEKDPLAVKLAKVPHIASQADITRLMQQFGTVDRVIIPDADRKTKDKLKIAIVKFNSSIPVEKLLESGHVVFHYTRDEDLTFYQRNVQKMAAKTEQSCILECYPAFKLKRPQ